MTVAYVGIYQIFQWHFVYWVAKVVTSLRLHLHLNIVLHSHTGCKHTLHNIPKRLRLRHYIISLWYVHYEGVTPYVWDTTFIICCL